MFDLSIIIPTCNRAPLLRGLLRNLDDGIECTHEIIIIDGNSADETAEVLESASRYFGSRLKVIRERQREGFVRAANKGFRIAGGRNLAWLHDDSRPFPGALDEAVRQMDGAQPDVALLAMFHRYNFQRNVSYEAIHNNRMFRLCHVRGTLFGNFSIGRRQTFEQLGWFDERYFTYSADRDLAMKAWNSGMKVEPAYGVFIDNDEPLDTLRAKQSSRSDEDGQKLLAKWNLPEKNVRWNDFDPCAPSTLRGLSDTASDNSCVPRVSFVIATHNRRDSLQDTLAQLRAMRCTAHFTSEVLVVDNASTDGTAEEVEANFPLTRLIRSHQNRGACAKNKAIAQATGQYIVFLDDDSYPEQASVRRMIETFQSNPRLGCAVFDVLLPDGSHEASAYPAAFIGCGAGFRAEALQSVGLLPDDFFMQAEEYDLSLRLLDAGWQIQRFADLRVHHNKTFAGRQPARTTRLDARNNLLVIHRNFPRKWVFPFAIDWMRRYHWLAQTRGWRHRAAFWRGITQGLLRSSVTLPKPVSAHAFEHFAMIDMIRSRLQRLAEERNIKSVLLLDVGKNILPFWLAARSLGIRIVAVADPRLAGPDRRYRGIPVVDDAAARKLNFDAAIVANVSPVQAALRQSRWQNTDARPAFDLMAPMPVKQAKTLAA
jgi:GT2 family glycosyltransferase